jgi:hypothetical protein
MTLTPDGAFTYTPTGNFNGTDSFTYRANDGRADSNLATVSLAVTPVNDAPVTVSDGYTTAEDTPLTIAAAQGVLANDTDVDGDPLTAVLVSGPTHGSLTLGTDGAFTYTSALHFNGSDSFSYMANDGTVDSNLAIVTLTITPVNDAPVATPDAVTTAEDTPLAITFTQLLANDTDVENDPLGVTVAADPTHGVLALTADGLLYTPDADFFGWDTFTYTATDGQADSNEAEVTLTVTPVNDAPVAFDDAYELPEGTALVISAPQGVLANDTDIEGDPLTAVLREGPAHGTLSLTADGAFTYSPDATYVGMDHFTYAAHDGQAASAPATVTLTVQPANQPPVFTSTPPSVFTLPPAMERGGDAVLYTPEAATLEVTWNRAEARYRNEVGLYRVDDAAGRVNGLLPTDPGYAEAALASGNATVLFARGAKTGTKTRVALTGDAYYGFFLVQDSTLATLRAQNPANQLRQKPLAFFSVTGANPDERDHLQASIEQHTLRLGWEDLTGLGDRDFDDAVLTAKLPARCALTFVQPARAPLPITVICPGTQDDQVLQVPQGSGQPVEAIVTWGPHEANARTDAGIFRVDDPSGRINGLLPADPGYAQAALARAEVLIDRGVPCGTETRLTLAPGAYYAFYLIQNSTSQNFLAKNPTNNPAGRPLAFFSLARANPDGLDHLRGTVCDGSLKLAWEDQLGGGDQDFNDAVLTLRLRQEAAPARFTYQAQAVDPDGDLLTYSLVNGPAEATIDATTGLLSWAALAGTYEFVIRVEDGHGGVAEQRFELVVQPASWASPPACQPKTPWVDWSRAWDGNSNGCGSSTPDWVPACLPAFALAGAPTDWVVNMPAPAVAG